MCIQKITLRARIKRILVRVFYGILIFFGLLVAWFILFFDDYIKGFYDDHQKKGIDKEFYEHLGRITKK